MRKAANDIITFILLLFYIYSIRLTFLPVTPKIMMEVLGLFVYMAYAKKNLIPATFVSFLFLLVVINIFGLFTVIINGTSEFIYIFQWLVAPIGAFFGSYFIYRASRKSITDITSFLKILSSVVFVESIITVFIRLSPSFASVVGSVQEYLLTEDDLAFGIQELYRFTGLGIAVYFGVIPSCAVGVMTTVYLLVNSKSRVQRLYYSFVFVFISVVSFLVAKTSALVVLLACLFYGYCLIRRKSFKMLGSMILVAITMVVLFNYAEQYLPRNVYKWAFDVFLEKDINTGSSGAVIDTWKHTKFDAKTFLIGDARYTEGQHYYKGVDVGYYREIYYGGIIGLLLIFMCNFKVVKDTMRYALDNEMKIMLLCLYGSYLIALGKGDLNMIDVFIMFFVFFYYITKEKSSNEILITQ